MDIFPVMACALPCMFTMNKVVKLNLTKTRDVFTCYCIMIADQTHITDRLILYGLRSIECAFL